MAAWLALCLSTGQPPALMPVPAGLGGAASAPKGGNP
jgi:hypothetical protein